LQDLAVLAPRRPDIGPQGLPVNRTAVAAGVGRADVGSGYRLVLKRGDLVRELTSAELSRLPQHGVTLPIACVEGWSAQAQWSGVRVSELMHLVDARPEDAVRVVSLERSGPYAVSELPAVFVQDPQTILALTLNGSELDLDHGYPGRIMAPNRPGVLQTKWVTRLEVV
jgi:DMSO/TMAO reductase YedYZ molybdopterin-dependent catalytic subunit